MFGVSLMYATSFYNLKTPLICNNQIFQQICKMTEDLQALLNHIKAALEEQNHKQSHPKGLAKEKMMVLLQKVQSLYQSSNFSLIKIINNPFISLKLSKFLYLRLRCVLGQQKLQSKYTLMTCKPKQTYFLMDTKKRTLTKQIIQNIKAIDAQLTKLSQNLESIPQQPSFFDQDTAVICELQVDILLNIMMETVGLELQKPVNEMLFRLFILQESVSLILHKAENLLTQMTHRLPSYEPLSGKSQQSTPNKRSVLSQSLLIFKSNELKKGLFLGVSNQQPQQTINRIRTDYLTQNKTEKKVNQTEKRGFCCFNF